MAGDTGHTHHAENWVTVVFQGCVAPDQCVPEAHGHVTDITTCYCGAVQKTNINRGHREIGPWGETERTP
jgi:hypothetical protein